MMKIELDPKQLEELAATLHARVEIDLSDRAVETLTRIEIHLADIAAALK